jgi:long-chain acyl-CoA synthetase
MARQTVDIIAVEVARTLAGLFRERVRRSAGDTAYRHFDRSTRTWQDTTWGGMRDLVARWQAGLERDGLTPGDRVALMLHNCREWVVFDQAALGLGLVVVPLYVNDRSESCAYVLQHSGAKMLLIGGPQQWQPLSGLHDELAGLRRILSLTPIEGLGGDPRLRSVEQWLPKNSDGHLRTHEGDSHAIATIVYTSGTTGRPKGVMLSHDNILSNAWSSLRRLTAYRQDVFLSFLPLSHMLERMAGYYLSMMSGSVVAFARSVPQLGEDLESVRPSVLIAVPRIFERFYNGLQKSLGHRSRAARKLFHQCVDVGWRRFLYQQGRAPWRPDLLLWPALHRLVGAKVLARLGGRVRIALCGGAPLPPEIARTFVGLGLTLGQGYGLTESSPVVSVFRLDENVPESVGAPLDGVEVRVGPNEELLVRGRNVMLGYWREPEATRRVIDHEGWLHTGDRARIRDGQIYITGRIKEIIVLANGEKVSPADMEMAIARDPLFDQVLVVGEGRPFLSALVVLNVECLHELAVDAGPRTLEDRKLKTRVLARIGEQLREFPGHTQVRKICLQLEPWNIEDGLLTPTLKLRRKSIVGRFADEIARLYEGH